MDLFKKMNSLQIQIIIQKYEPLKNKFIGVFSSNNIPSSVKRKNFCFIANTMRKGTKGEHWIACFSDEPNVIEYFDSFAEEPNCEMRQSLLANYSKIKQNRFVLQSPFSDTCGHYCICFLVLRTHYANFSEVLQKMHSIPAEGRDYALRKFVQRLALL